MTGRPTAAGACQEYNDAVIKNCSAVLPLVFLWWQLRGLRAAGSHGGSLSSGAWSFAAQALGGSSGFQSSRSTGTREFQGPRARHFSLPPSSSTGPGRLSVPGATASRCSPHVLQRDTSPLQCFIINVRITCGAAVGTMASRPSDLSRERTQTPSAELRTRPNPMTWSSSFVDAGFWRVSRNSDTLPQNIMRIQSASSSPDNIRFPFCRIRGAVNLSASGRRKRPGMMDRMSPAAMLSSLQ